MTDLGEKLANAISSKDSDINSFIWKNAREIVNGEKKQTEIRLVDASPEQLNKFYNHCISMLYNRDKSNPGRYVLLDIIHEQRKKCCAELYLRWLENTYLSSTDRTKVPRFYYLQSIRDCLKLNKTTLPKEIWKDTPISTITGGVPDEFALMLDIDTVMDACLDTLGTMDRKHITLNFLLKMGVWFTPQELKDLTERTSTGEIRDRRDVVKERLGLHNNAPIKINPSAMLNYSELRSMLLLKTKKYSDLTTDQLLTLRNKVLFKLEDEALAHIDQWQERMRQIELVAKSKGIVLETVQ